MASHIILSILLELILLHMADSRRTYTSCGKSYTREPRIVGGTTAGFGEFPWIVSILLNGVHFCGGALIENQWALTAAHCVYRDGKDKFVVRAGEYRLDRPETPPHVDIPVQQILINPNYVHGRYLNDIALLRLSSPVEWDKTKQPICLPSAGFGNYVGVNATVAGWGWLDEPNNGGQRSNVLMKLRIPVVDSHVCESWYRMGGKTITISPKHMCAGYMEGGRDSCRGDSGGPLMLPVRGHYELIGIVSAGIGCARRFFPGLYTKVIEFESWINETIEQFPTTNNPLTIIQPTTKLPSVWTWDKPKTNKPQLEDHLTTVKPTVWEWFTSTRKQDIYDETEDPAIPTTPAPYSENLWNSGSNSLAFSNLWSWDTRRRPASNKTRNGLTVNSLSPYISEKNTANRTSAMSLNIITARPWWKWNYRHYTTKRFWIYVKK